MEETVFPEDLPIDLPIALPIALPKDLPLKALRVFQDLLLQENDEAGNPVLPALICYSLNRSAVRNRVIR